MKGFTFTWLIDRFSPSDLPDTSKEIRSPAFKVDSIKANLWQLVLTFESNEEYFSCSLVRFGSLEKRTEVIEIDLSIEIASEDKKVDVQTHKANVTFKEFEYYLCGLFKYDFSAAKLIIWCHMIECLSKETLAALEKIYYTKIGHLSWSPSCASEEAFFCGAGPKFQVSLKNIHNKVSLKIKRIDDTDSDDYPLCIIACKIYIHDKKNLTYSKVIGNMVDYHHFNEPLELPLGLNKNQIIGSHSYFIEIYFNCSIFGGKMWLSSHMDVNFLHSIKRPIKLDSMISSSTTNALRNDFDMLYTEKIHTDLKLKVEAEVFDVHKSILSARSPVFRTMFDQDMRENITGIVNITDIDANCVDKLLKFIYSGTCGQLDYESALNLMLIAEKYQVHSLKKVCSNYLIPTLSEDNVCDILNTADMVSDINLKACAMNYVKLHADNALLSDRWKELAKSNVTLVSEALSNLSTDFGATAKQKKRFFEDPLQWFLESIFT